MADATLATPEKVAAIDFGTGFCSLAYTLKKDDEIAHIFLVIHHQFSPNTHHSHWHEGSFSAVYIIEAFLLSTSCCLTHTSGVFSIQNLVPEEPSDPMSFTRARKRFQVPQSLKNSKSGEELHCLKPSMRMF